MRGEVLQTKIALCFKKHLTWTWSDIALLRIYSVYHICVIVHVGEGQENSSSLIPGQVGRSGKGAYLFKKVI